MIYYALEQLNLKTERMSRTKVKNKKMKVVIINGSGGSGKDTFVELAKKHYDEVYNVSTVDLVKYYAKKMGWNNGKTQKDRLFLQQLKEIWEEYNEGTTKYVLNVIEGIEAERNELEPIVFVHCREPWHIEFLKNTFLKHGYLVKTLLILKKETTETWDNSSDNETVLKYNYDDVISNNDTLEVLEKKAMMYIKDLMGEK